jgi:hypothetical protein
MAEYKMYHGKGYKIFKNTEDPKKFYKLSFWVEPHDGESMKEYTKIIEQALAGELI